MSTDTMRDFATVAWELRWVIAAAAVMAAAAVPIARHVERDRQRITELAAETTRADHAEQRLATLQHALISHRLRAAQHAGVIRRVGKTPSTLKSTHAHDINVYRGTK